MHPALTRLRSFHLTNRRSIIVGIAAAIVGGAAIAADQPPYNYGATQQTAPAPAPSPSAPAQAQEQPKRQSQPDGRQFNYKPMPPEESGGAVVKKERPKPKPRSRSTHKVAEHRSGRAAFNYDLRYIDKAKLRRCIKELPWRGLLKNQDSPARRREFCETYQIEAWAKSDQKKVRTKLEEIFNQSKPKPKPKPQQEMIPNMGF